MNSPVLALQSVTRSYAQENAQLRVLDQLNLEVRAGEIVALVGPSGSGKTTLLQVAGLLDVPTSGDVVINGQYMRNASDGVRTAARRQHIGYVYQFHHLLPEFSALENVMMPQMIANVPPRQTREKAKSLLSDLGLAERFTHRPAKLSGGERQRVAIARALANDPMLLLADEPTGNLDHHTAEQVFTVLLQAARRRNVAALIATHNMELAQRMDRILRLEDGMLKPA